jgi:hypothetical protein
MNRIENSEGHVGDLAGSGFTAFASLITIHHLMIVIGTRNFTLPLTIIYIVSYMMFMPLTVFLNEFVKGATTYRTVFPTVMGGTWLFWLSFFFGVSMVCLPIFMLKSYEMLYRKPKSE